MSFDNFRSLVGNTRALEGCLRYIANWPKRATGRGLAVFGDRGFGKTHLAVAMCRELAHEYHIKPAYTTLLDFEETQALSEVSRWPRLLGAEFLVIDGLGARAVAFRPLVQLLTVIEYRLSEAMPMMITSNSFDWQLLYESLFPPVVAEEQGPAREVLMPIALRTFRALKEASGDSFVITGGIWGSVQSAG